MQNLLIITIKFTQCKYKINNVLTLTKEYIEYKFLPDFFLRLDSQSLLQILKAFQLALFFPRF